MPQGHRFGVVENDTGGSLTTFDVGLIGLDTPATASDPRPIALDCILDDYMVDGAEIAIVGYGATNEWGTHYVDQLQEAYTWVTDADCSVGDEGCNRDARPAGEFIGAGDGIDTCYGDSGGPAYLLTEAGDFLIGVTSRGSYTAGWSCGGGTIFVRADATVDWIEDTAGVVLDRPECAPPPPLAASEDEGGDDGEDGEDGERDETGGCSSTGTNLHPGWPLL